jgi:hypothetical protein
MKKLPLGIPTLSKIIHEGYAYVDKSRFVHELADSGKYYFLSRPRRFGKPLFVDTLKEPFEGNRELFRGLWLEDPRSRTWTRPRAALWSRSSARAMRTNTGPNPRPST